MIESNKTYGFTIAVKELRETVPNIFRYASAYKRLKGIKSQGLWEMFVEPQPEKGHEPPPDEIDPEGMEGEKYNMCHFWSNFEIARLDFFRSKEYEDFFQMMDRSGGFWMERVCLFCFPLSSIPPVPPPPFHSPLPNCHETDTSTSGATHQSTPSRPARSSPRATSTTSATLATATRRSSTARRTRRHASCRGSPGSRRRRWTSGSGKKKTRTGRSGMSRRRMGLGAGAGATRILWMSRGRRGVVWRSGWMLRGVGRVLEDTGVHEVGRK